jgi:hypothetical protein
VGFKSVAKEYAVFCDQAVTIYSWHATTRQEKTSMKVRFAQAQSMREMTGSAVKNGSCMHVLQVQNMIDPRSAESDAMAMDRCSFVSS